MKPYSLDLRQKIINVYKKEPISQRQLAKRFNVALSFIQKLLKQERETGNIAPKIRQIQTPTKLTFQQQEILLDLVKKDNDATLEELRDNLSQVTGVLVSVTTIYNMLKRLNITRKKKHCLPQKKVAIKFKNNV